MVKFSRNKQLRVAWGMLAISRKKLYEALSNYLVGDATVITESVYMVCIFGLHSQTNKFRTFHVYAERRSRQHLLLAVLLFFCFFRFLCWLFLATRKTVQITAHFINVTSHRGNHAVKAFYDACKSRYVLFCGVWYIVTALRF